MAPFLTFTDLSRQDLDELRLLSGPQQKKVLKRLMRLDRLTGFEAGIILDFHFQNLKWAMQQEMEPEQISTFVSIMKKTLHEVWYDRMELDDSFESFKVYLLMHSVHRPPYSTGIFNAGEVEKITDYVLNTFFRHFKLYQYVHVAFRELQVAVLTEEPPEEEEEEEEFQLAGEDDGVEVKVPDHILEEDEELPEDEGERNEADGIRRNLPVGIPLEDVEATVSTDLAQSFESAVNARLDGIEKNLDTRLDSLIQKIKQKK